MRSTAETAIFISGILDYLGYHIHWFSSQPENSFHLFTFQQISHFNTPSKLLYMKKTTKQTNTFL